MSKDITENILLRAGFRKKESTFVCSTQTDNRKRIIVVTLGGSAMYCSAMYGRDYTLLVCNGNRDPIGYACIQTTDHFNKLMELMDIDFRLKED